MSCDRPSVNRCTAPATRNLAESQSQLDKLYARAPKASLVSQSGGLTHHYAYV
jgi:hypothetical protein